MEELRRTTPLVDDAVFAGAFVKSRQNFRPRSAFVLKVGTRKAERVSRGLLGAPLSRWCVAAPAAPLPPLPPSHHRLFVHMVVDGCGGWACVRVCRRLPLPVPSSLGPDQGELRQRGVDSAIVTEATEECVLVSAERMECVCVGGRGGGMWHLCCVFEDVAGIHEFDSSTPLLLGMMKLQRVHGWPSESEAWHPTSCGHTCYASGSRCIS